MKNNGRLGTIKTVQFCLNLKHNLKPKLHRFTKAAPSQTAEQGTIVNPNLKTIGSTRSGLMVHSGSDSENSSLLSNSISLLLWISLFLVIIGLDLLGIHSCYWFSIVSFNIFVSYLRLPSKHGIYNYLYLLQTKATLFHLSISL